MAWTSPPGRSQAWHLWGRRDPSKRERDSQSDISLSLASLPKLFPAAESTVPAAPCSAGRPLHTVRILPPASQQRGNWAHSVEPVFSIDGAQLSWPEQGLVGDPHAIERALELSGPERQEIVE